MDSLAALASPVVIVLLMGGLYVVIALGLSLVFGVMKVINVAHGDLGIFGSYLAFSALTMWGLNPLWWLLPSLPLFFILGFLIEKYLLNRAAKISADAALIIAFGLALIVQNASQLIWTPQTRSLITVFTMTTFKIGKVYIPLVYLLDFAVALVVMVAVQQFLKRTYLGQAITAASQDRQTAELMGINPSRVYQIAFGIAMALASIAGIFFGLTFSFNPTSGNALLIIAFGVIILGGLGSMVGTC